MTTNNQNQGQNQNQNQNTNQNQNSNQNQNNTTIEIDEEIYNTIKTELQNESNQKIVELTNQVTELKHQLQEANRKKTIIISQPNKVNEVKNDNKVDEIKDIFI